MTLTSLTQSPPALAGCHVAFNLQATLPEAPRFLLIYDLVMRPSCPPERAQCPAPQDEPPGTAQAGLGSGSQAGHTHRLRFWPWQRQVYLLKPSCRLCPRPVRSPHGGGVPGSRRSPVPPGTFRRASRRSRCRGLSPLSRGPELRPRSAEPRRAQRPPARSAMAAAPGKGLAKAG